MDTHVDPLVPLLSLAEVAYILGVTRRYVFTLIRRQELAVVELGRRRLVEAQELRAFVNRHRRPSAP
jgi:excisionase family DNA binding protein